MYKTALLATTALVVGASVAMAGVHKAPPGGVHMIPHKDILNTVTKNKGFGNQGIVLKTQKGAHVVNHQPVVLPGTFSNLSNDANAQFVSWYGFYASSSCFSYYGSANYHYFECFYENSAVPFTGAGKAIKKISDPVYAGSGGFRTGVYSDASGSPGGLIHGGSGTGVSTSYCCTALQTTAIHKTVAALGTPYWTEVTSSGGYSLWLTEDTDYSTGQHYDWHYGYFETYNFGSGTFTTSYNSGWISSTASPYRPAVAL